MPQCLDFCTSTLSFEIGKFVLLLDNSALLLSIVTTWYGFSLTSPAVSSHTWLLSGYPILEHSPPYPPPPLPPSFFSCSSHQLLLIICFGLKTKEHCLIIDVMLSISPTMHGSPAQRGLGNNRPWYSFRMKNSLSLTPILTHEVHNKGSNCPTIFTGFTLPRELSLYLDTQYEFFQ